MVYMHGRCSGAMARIVSMIAVAGSVCVAGNRMLRARPLTDSIVALFREQKQDALAQMYRLICHVSDTKYEIRLGVTRAVWHVYISQYKYKGCVT